MNNLNTILTINNIKGFLNFNKNGFPLLNTKIGDNSIFFQIVSEKFKNELQNLKNKMVQLNGIYTINDKGFFSLILTKKPIEIDTFNNGIYTTVKGKVFFVNPKEHETKDNKKFYSAAISFKYNDGFKYLNVLSKNKIKNKTLYNINSFFKSKIDFKTKKPVIYLNISEIKPIEKNIKENNNNKEKKVPEYEDIPF